MNRRKPAHRQAPNYRAESESLAALYARSGATDDREAGRQQSARARRLGALVALAGHRELDESERDELSRLVAGKEPPVAADVTLSHFLGEQADGT